MQLTLLTRSLLLLCILTGVSLHGTPACADQQETPAAITGDSVLRLLKISGTVAAPIPRGHSDYAIYENYWLPVYHQHNPEKAYGKDISILSPPVLKQWRNLASGMKKYSAVQQLQYINGFFNRWTSGADDKLYGQEEYWATPEEFLDKGGDCEDFAIVKYFALKYFGWNEDNLWVVLVRNEKEQYNHAVLAVHDGKKTFILDNLSRPAYLLIAAESYFTRVTPLFALNSSGMWTLMQNQNAPQAKSGKKSSHQHISTAKTQPQ